MSTAAAAAAASDHDASTSNEELYQQIHDLAVRHGSTLIMEAARKAARTSKQVQRKDEALRSSSTSILEYEINDESADIQTLMFDFPTSETYQTPHAAIELASTLMSGAMTNQPKRLHLEFCRQPGELSISFCSLCLTVLSEYYQIVTKQPHLRSMMGTLTLESISQEVLDSILRDEDVMSLFDSLQFHNMCDCLVPSPAMDRLRALIPACDLQELRLDQCRILGRDLEALARTKGLRILHLNHVRVEDSPVFVPNLKRKVVDLACLPRIMVHILNPGFYAPARDSLWQTVELMPKIDELSVNVEVDPSLTGLRQHIIRLTTPIQGLRFTSSTPLENPSAYASAIAVIVDQRHEKPLLYVHMESDFVEDGHDDYDEVDEILAAQIILDCALSTTHNLHSLSFRFGSLEPMITAMTGRLESLENHNIIMPTQPGVSRLRRFDFFGTYHWGMSHNNLQTMLTFLTTHLPYVYYIGQGSGNLATYELWKIQDLRNLSKQILLQLERNQVGMALLHPDVYESVPPGIWPLILENAVSRRPTSSKMKIPVSGVFALVKALAARDVISSVHPKQDDPAIKRRKLNTV